MRFILLVVPLLAGFVQAEFLAVSDGSGPWRTEHAPVHDRPDPGQGDPDPGAAA